MRRRGVDIYVAEWQARLHGEMLVTGRFVFAELRLWHRIIIDLHTKAHRLLILAKKITFCVVYSTVQRIAVTGIIGFGYLEHHKETWKPGSSQPPPASPNLTSTWGTRNT
jgi:hypothetical protein